jgi:hypothetical protein
VIPVYSFTRVRSTNPKCTRGCGCNGHPAFPAPSVFIGRKLHTQLGRTAPRGREAASGFGVIASAAKQSILPSRGEMDCFAPLAMTAPHLDRLCCLKLEPRHCEERSDEAIHSFFARRDGLLRFARNDGSASGSSVLFEIRAPSLRVRHRPWGRPCWMKRYGGKIIRWVPQFLPRSGATKQSILFFCARWIASRTLSSGAHSRDPLARNDGRLFDPQGPSTHEN